MSGSGFRLDFAARSDVGSHRRRNEDALAVDGDLGLVAVADGIGGAPAGDVASSKAVEAVIRRLREGVTGGVAADPEALVRDAVLGANRELLEAGESTPALHGMGTTLVVGHFRPGRLVYGHVGDSRLYLWREGRLDQLTRDHSLAQEAVDRGEFPSLEEALRGGVPGYVITRALGNPSLGGPDIDRIDVLPGDRFLFCTDGLTNLVGRAQIAQVLGGAASTDQAADTLVRLANEAGGYDNITVVLARVPET